MTKKRIREPVVFQSQYGVSAKGSDNPSINPGRVIYDRRRELGLKAIELARRSRVNPRTLDAIEKGRIVTPSISILVV